MGFIQQKYEKLQESDHKKHKSFRSFIIQIFVYKNSCIFKQIV